MKKLITLTDVTAGYEGRPQISGVTLAVNKGDFIGIVGPNGGGKTTLLKVLLKLIPTMSGKVEYWCNGTPAERIAIGYLPQFSNIDRDFPIYVLDTVMQGLNSRKPLFSRFTTHHRQLAVKALESLEVADLARRPIKALSGGQLQRVLLARAIVSHPDVLVLDEPNTYIDQTSQELMMSYIRQLSSSCAIIMVSHDTEHLRDMASTIVEVNERVTLLPH